MSCYYFKVLIMLKISKKETWGANYRNVLAWDTTKQILYPGHKHCLLDFELTDKGSGGLEVRVGHLQICREQKHRGELKMMSWSNTDQEGLTDRIKHSTSSQTKKLYDFNSVTSIGKKKISGVKVKKQALI